MWERYVGLLMARSNEERLLMGSRMFDAARAMMLASAPANLAPAELRAWLYQRTYGEPLPPWASEQNAARANAPVSPQG